MLRSVSGMRGFTMHATDGDSGSVDEFLFDDAQWTIRYLVANTGGWLTGRLVFVAPIAFRSIDGDRETQAFQYHYRCAMSLAVAT
ncbi:MAG TPA: PRC-barrel domain-containing protein [Candidatus Saccharimonadia bacterium]|nr:PRC-barrel domain-containing protein [Candidatus Saccharimonadia bacterium]